MKNRAASRCDPSSVACSRSAQPAPFPVSVEAVACAANTTVPTTTTMAKEIFTTQIFFFSLERVRVLLRDS
jgi:hypothetical protein